MNILILSPIDRDAIRELQTHHQVTCALDATADELRLLIRECEVLVFRSGVQITADLMNCARHLKLLVRAGSGFDNVDLVYVREHGLQFERIPQPGAKAVAELSFGCMLALARNLLNADQLLRQGRWAKYELEGFLLTGKVLGIVGAGNIGSRVGQLGAAWGMEVIGCVKRPSSVVTRLRAKDGIRLTTFDEVLSASDFVSLHVPLTDSTRNLIDTEELSVIKEGAFLINLARGGVVNERALYKELTEGGRLRGAALDVHEHEGEGKISPLADLSNVILTPHIGASTVDSQREIGQRTVSIINSYVSQQIRQPTCDALSG